MKSQSKLPYILIGVGIGATVGGGTAYLISRKKLSKARTQLEEARKAKKRAYLLGIEEATQEAQRWIDSNVKIIDATDPSSAQKAIDDAFSTTTTSASNPNAPSEISISPKSTQKTPVREDDGKTAYLDNVYAESPDKPKDELIGEDEVGFRFQGKLLKYPRKLFFDENGESLGELRVRENLRVYETDKEKLNELWQALGYGIYFPDEPDETEPGDMDVSIDADENDDPEPEIKSKERERYLEEVRRYNDNPNEGPRIVSKKEFDEECYLDKVWINYYAGDNVFVDSMDMDSEVDAVTLLGVSDGNYLFENRPQFPEDEDDNDPDIVHVRNFKMNTIAEVTRQKCAYAAVRDGSVYLDGNSSEGGGA